MFSEILRKYLKGLIFFEWVSYKPLLSIWRLFEFGFKFGEIFAIFDWLSSIVYSGEFICPILLTTKSCNSLHNSQQGVTNVWISSAENLACRLMQGVDTPHIVYHGESWLPASFIAGIHWRQREYFLTILKDSLCL